MVSVVNNINPNDFINIIQWNVRSLPARLPSLQHLLNDHKYTIALLSETWLLSSRFFSIQRFRTYRSERRDGYGDVVIVIHKSLKSE